MFLMPAKKKLQNLSKKELVRLVRTKELRLSELRANKETKEEKVGALDFFLVRIITLLVAVPGFLLFWFLTSKFKLSGAIIGIIILVAYMIPLIRKITKKVTGST